VAVTSDEGGGCEEEGEEEGGEPNPSRHDQIGWKCLEEGRERIVQYKSSRGGSKNFFQLVPAW
jgi:hypothetical protein